MRFSCLSMAREGKGKPLSQLDEFCKELHEGYQCALMDSNAIAEQEQRAYDCIPWAVDYESGYTDGVLALNEECRVRNQGNECAILACTVEGNFIGH